MATENFIEKLTELTATLIVTRLELDVLQAGIPFLLSFLLLTQSETENVKNMALEG
jgi:hypothetical protein